VHAVTRRLAEQEVLRYFRRRETFWTLFAFGSFFGLYHLALALIWVPAKTAFEADPAVADVFRSHMVFLEAVVLWVLAFQGGLRTVRQELDTGSWILLAQTPNPTSRIWAGKLLGVAASLLLLHGFLSLPVLAFTPLIRRTHVEVATLFLGVFLYAAAVVPEGMGYALVGKRWPRLVYFLRLLTVVRIVMPLPFLLAVLRPDLLGELPGPEALSPFGYGGFPPFTLLKLPSPEAFAHPWVPVAIVLSVQLLTAVPWWLALARSRR